MMRFFIFIGALARVAAQASQTLITNPSTPGEMHTGVNQDGQSDQIVSPPTVSDQTSALFNPAGDPNTSGDDAAGYDPNVNIQNFMSFLYYISARAAFYSISNYDITQNEAINRNTTDISNNYAQVTKDIADNYATVTKDIADTKSDLQGQIDTIVNDTIVNLSNSTGTELAFIKDAMTTNNAVFQKSLTQVMADCKTDKEWMEVEFSKFSTHVDDEISSLDTKMDGNFSATDADIAALKSLVNLKDANTQLEQASLKATMQAYDIENEERKTALETLLNKEMESFETSVHLMQKELAAAVETSNSADAELNNRISGMTSDSNTQLSSLEDSLGALVATREAESLRRSQSLEQTIETQLSNLELRVANALTSVIAKMNAMDGGKCGCLISDFQCTCGDMTLNVANSMVQIIPYSLLLQKENKLVNGASGASDYMGNTVPSYNATETNKYFNNMLGYTMGFTISTFLSVLVTEEESASRKFGSNGIELNDEAVFMELQVLPVTFTGFRFFKQACSLGKRYKATMQYALDQWDVAKAGMSAMAKAGISVTGSDNLVTGASPSYLYQPGNPLNNEASVVSRKMQSAESLEDWLNDIPKRMAQSLHDCMIDGAASSDCVCADIFCSGCASDAAHQSYGLLSIKNRPYTNWEFYESKRVQFDLKTYMENLGYGSHNVSLSTIGTFCGPQDESSLGNYSCTGGDYDCAKNREFYGLQSTGQCNLLVNPVGLKCSSANFDNTYKCVSADGDDGAYYDWYNWGKPPGCSVLQVSPQGFFECSTTRCPSERPFCNSSNATCEKTKSSTNNAADKNYDCTGTLGDVHWVLHKWTGPQNDCKPYAPGGARSYINDSISGADIINAVAYGGILYNNGNTIEVEDDSGEGLLLFGTASDNNFTCDDEPDQQTTNVTIKNASIKGANASNSFRLKIHQHASFDTSTHGVFIGEDNSSSSVKVLSGYSGETRPFGTNGAILEIGENDLLVNVEGTFTIGGCQGTNGFLRSGVIIGGNITRATIVAGKTRPTTLPTGAYTNGWNTWGFRSVISYTQDFGAPPEQPMTDAGVETWPVDPQNNSQDWTANYMSRGKDWSCENISAFGQLPGVWLNTNANDKYSLYLVEVVDTTKAIDPHSGIPFTRRVGLNPQCVDFDLQENAIFNWDVSLSEYNHAFDAWLGNYDQEIHHAIKNREVQTVEEFAVRTATEIADSINV